MKKKIELTKLETALIDQKLIFDNLTWTEIYQYTKTGGANLSRSSLPSRVSAYKNSQLVRDYIKQATAKIETRLMQFVEEKGFKRDEDGKGAFSPGDVNFTDITEFINYLNSKANTLQDEKERQKYLQMLSDLLRFKDSDPKETDIMRFYTPLKCSVCPLKRDL